MAIYVFSLLVLHEPNGVDNAQGIRSRYLKKTNQVVKYVYTDLPWEKYIQRYTDTGIEILDMLCAHHFMAGNNHIAGNAGVKEKIEKLKEDFGVTRIWEQEQNIQLYRNEKRVASIALKENREFFSHIDFYENERLIVTEYYGDRLLHRHYYVTDREDGQAYARRVRTSFVNEEGVGIYDCIYDKDGEEHYVFTDGRRYSKQQFLIAFIKKLNLTEKDIVILDRPSFLEYVQPLFQYGNKAKFVAFLHSGHYFLKGEDASSLYINYEYYYWFKYAKYLKWMLVSTEEQKQDLREKLLEYECEIPKLKAIPAGGLDKLRYPLGERKKYSLVTVSRLHDRKHVDWVIESVIRAHEKLPELSLDIYGKGEEGYVANLKEYVQVNQADSYIHFMGYGNVREIYTNYEAYISASLWETLGLSLMEAVGSGNAMLGLDVRYGNRLFIENGKNGYRIPFKTEDVEHPEKVQEVIEKMAEAIVELFRDEERLRCYQAHSYEIAEQFLNEKIEKQWVDFIETIEKE